MIRWSFAPLYYGMIGGTPTIGIDHSQGILHQCEKTSVKNASAGIKKRGCSRNILKQITYLCVFIKDKSTTYRWNITLELSKHAGKRTGEQKTYIVSRKTPAAPLTTSWTCSPTPREQACMSVTH